MKKEVSKARCKTYGARENERDYMHLDIFESDSSYRPHYARRSSERSAYTHDESTTYSESEESSDSDESESTEPVLRNLIKNIFMCGSAWESKDEQTVNNYCYESVFPASLNYSYTASNYQRNIMSEMNKELEYNIGTMKIRRFNDEDDDTCAHEESDDHYVRVTDTVLNNTSIDSEATTVAETIPGMLSEISQAVSHTVSKTPNKIDFDCQPCLLFRAIDTRSWKYAHEILRKSPKEASTWVYRRNKGASGYTWMFLPIHVACFSGAPLDIVKILVRTYPQGVRMAANGGKIPLHIACETLARSTIITFLHNMYSEAQYAIDESGHTPRQKALFCKSKPERERIMKLLTAFSLR